MLLRVNEVCPQLFIQVSPVSRWINRIGIDDDEFIGQLGNASAIRGLNKIKEHQLRDYMLPRASPGTWIRTAIMNHYAKSPATTLPASLPAFRLRCYAKVTLCWNTPLTVCYPTVRYLSVMQAPLTMLANALQVSHPPSSLGAHVMAVDLPSTAGGSIVTSSFTGSTCHGSSTCHRGRQE
jgi:hypothetical protein